jgi:hypothetical protein
MATNFTCLAPASDDKKQFSHESHIAILERADRVPYTSFV